MPCANGTVFNPGVGVCDHPWNVTGCGGTIPPPDTTTEPIIITTTTNVVIDRK